ncbi:MAG: hypothetical protein N2505_06755, partial [Endomicrobia bacterium]|nr:hypothetical protein [Endomicrobiia bacterium]
MNFRLENRVILGWAFFCVFLIFITGQAFAEDGINSFQIPTSERELYFKIDVSKEANGASRSLKPYSCEKAGQMLLEVSSYCRKSKLVRYAELIASYNTKRTALSLLPEEEGIRLEEGYNLHYTIG